MDLCFSPTGGSHWVVRNSSGSSNVVPKEASEASNKYAIFDPINPRLDPPIESKYTVFDPIPTNSQTNTQISSNTNSSEKSQNHAILQNTTNQPDSNSNHNHNINNSIDSSPKFSENLVKEINIHENLEKSAQKICNWIYNALSLKPKSHEITESLPQICSEFDQFNKEVNEIQKNHKDFYNITYKNKIVDLAKVKTLATDIAKSSRDYIVLKIVQIVFISTAAIFELFRTKPGTIKNIFNGDIKQAPIKIARKLCFNVLPVTTALLLINVPIMCIYPWYEANKYRKKAEELNQMIKDTSKHTPKTKFDPLK